MTVDREVPSRRTARVRGSGHAVGVRRRWPLGDRARIGLFVLGVLALAVVATVAVLPSRSGKSRLLPPVQAQLSAPPLVPVPTATGSPVVPGQPPALPSSAAPGAGTAPTTSAAAPPARSRPAPVLTRTLVFEAESAVNTLTGDTHVKTADRASGGLSIGAIGGGVANTLRFNAVTVPATGTYTLTVFYLSGEDRGLTIAAGGRAPVSVVVASTGSFDTVGSLTLRVVLAGGRNSIVFGNPDQRAPDIDRIAVGN
jgi:hypothetical protein